MVSARLAGMDAIQIRDSRDDDVAAIQALYAHHVLHGTGTFELDPPTPDEMRARRADVLRNASRWERFKAKVRTSVITFLQRRREKSRHLFARASA